MTIKSMKLHLESIKFRELSFLFSPQHHAPEVMENNKQNKRLNIYLGCKEKVKTQLKTFNVSFRI